MKGFSAEVRTHKILDKQVTERETRKRLVDNSKDHFDRFKDAFNSQSVELWERKVLHSSPKLLELYSLAL